MKLSLNWIKQFVELPSALSPAELANLITLHTAEVDGVENEAENFEHMVVGEITEVKPHPDADKLRICDVNIGAKTVQIVCGGSNLEPKQLVAVGLPGAKVKWHGEGDLITLEETKIRGEKSFGMICAAEEIGMGASQGKEIMDLSSTKAKPGTPLSEVLNKNDVVIEIDNKSITHRPDLWSHYGFAREVAAITNSKLHPYPIPKLSAPSTGAEIKLKITDKEIVKKWNSVVINNIKIEESPDWLKQKLEAIDVRPVNNVVDVTNYVMYELGQPLHAYDKDLLGNLECEIRFAKKGEKLETIDHKERALTEQDPILINQGKPVIILGVMGGVNSEVSDKTTSILLESATFDATIIRKSSTLHALRSDASQRFEKSLDPNQTRLALEKAAELILQLCPNAELGGPITEIETEKTSEIKIKLDPERVRKYLGIDLQDTEIKAILEKLDFACSPKFEITVPTYRATKDVQQEVDLIEEVARIYGYDKIQPTLPELSVKPPIENLSRKREHSARSILMSLGLSETLNYSFYSKKDLANCLLDESEHLKPLNTLSEEQSHLRTSLVPGMLKNIQTNQKSSKEVKLFEFGRTYREIGKFFPAEEEMLGMIFYCKENSFFKLKGILEKFLEEFAHSDILMEPDTAPPSTAHPNKSMQMVDEKGEVIGRLYIVHPLISQNYGLNDVAFVEINFRKLEHSPSYSRIFRPVSKFPELEFDLSIALPKKTPAAEVKSALQNASELITDVTLFDIYEGKNIEGGDKALAYKIKLRSDERTLTDQDLSQTQEACKQALQKIGGTIRGGQ